MNEQTRIVAINVDLQNDFFPGGSLGVDKGQEVIEPLNLINQAVRDNGGKVIFTRDWHPVQTNHFTEFGGPWPAHCVADTFGGKFHEDIILKPSDTIVSKGTIEDEDAYSGFQGFSEEGFTLEVLIEPKLNEKLIVAIGGLATDYCVKATVLDVLKIKNQNQIEVYAVTDAMRPVNIRSGDGEIALEEMRHAGAMLATAREVIERISR